MFARRQKLQKFPQVILTFTLKEQNNEVLTVLVQYPRHSCREVAESGYHAPGRSTQSSAGEEKAKLTKQNRN